MRSSLPRYALLEMTISVVLAVACRAVNAPPRSPLADTATAVASTATSVIPPIVTVTAPVRTGTPVSGETEPAVARAMALMAEWLAVPQRDLALVSATPTVWSSSCLGVSYSGIACAAVVTPGFRVVLRDPLGARHTVDLDAQAGSAHWAGELTAAGTITALDHAQQTVTLDVAGKPLVLRAVPGTYWVPNLVGASVVGAQVTTGYDPSGTASAVAVAAWIALGQ